MSVTTQNRYRLGDTVAKQVAALRRDGYDLTLDIGDEVSCIIWSRNDRLQMQGEVAKHYAASVEAAVKGALKQMQKAR